MKKVMLVAAFGAIVSLQSRGDYMKWMVDPSSISSASVDTHIEGDNRNVALANMRNYKYAALVASDSAPHTGDNWSVSVYDPDSTALNSYVGDAASSQPIINSLVFADGSTIAAANIGNVNDYASKYFFIELFDAAGQLVGYSDAIMGSQLADYKDTSRFTADWANTSAWGGVGTHFTAVPEPTGGLMILLGAGLIGLRRKKFI